MSFNRDLRSAVFISPAKRVWGQSVREGSVYLLAATIGTWAGLGHVLTEFRNSGLLQTLFKTLPAGAGMLPSYFRYFQGPSPLHLSISERLESSDLPQVIQAICGREGDCIQICQMPSECSNHWITTLCVSAPTEHCYFNALCAIHNTQDHKAAAGSYTD